MIPRLNTSENEIVPEDITVKVEQPKQHAKQVEASRSEKNSKKFKFSLKLKIAIGFLILIIITALSVSLAILSRGSAEIEREDLVIGIDESIVKQQHFRVRAPWEISYESLSYVSIALPGRTLQESSQDGCIYTNDQEHPSITVRQCTDSNPEVLIDGNDLLQDANLDLQEEDGEVGRRLEEADVPALLEVLGEDLQAEFGEYSAANVVSMVEVDEHGIVVEGDNEGVDAEDHQRRLGEIRELGWRKKLKRRFKRIRKSIGKGLNVIRKHGAVIGGVVGAVVGSIVPGVGTMAGYCLGSAIGNKAQTALEACYPGDKNSLKFKCTSKSTKKAFSNYRKRKLLSMCS